jgi:hypothetical protein
MFVIVCVVGQVGALIFLTKHTRGMKSIPRIIYMMGAIPGSSVLITAVSYVMISIIKQVHTKICTPT